MPSPTPTGKPAGNLTSGQFINIQKLHIAKMLTDAAGGAATYEAPIPLGKLLRKVDIKPQTNQVELFADGQSVDTASNTASYDLTFDTAALPLEYTAYLLGHSIENGVMKAGKDDVAPYFAVIFQSDKRNGKKRYTKFYKVQFTEPSESGNSKQESIQFDTPTLTAKAIY
ncbi:major tail protein, partial [uncultured Selenomonas sp.]|uniref:major tail protein n=1 Tax=uncultured Selenomonas sp. TaxID=159275 RepID=UPI0026773100